MPARVDYYWRKSDSHPRETLLTVIAGIIATSCADSNQKNLFFLTERSVVSASPHVS
jgi:hypothetical protein